MWLRHPSSVGTLIPFLFATARERARNFNSTCGLSRSTSYNMDTVGISKVHTVATWQALNVVVASMWYRLGRQPHKDCRGVPPRATQLKESWFRVVHLEQRGKVLAWSRCSRSCCSTNRNSSFPTFSTVLGASASLDDFCWQPNWQAMSIRPSRGTELYLHTTCSMASVPSHSEAVLQSTSLPVYRHYSKRGLIPPPRKKRNPSGLLVPPRSALHPSSHPAHKLSR